MPNERNSVWASFQIVDRDSCEKAIRNGGFAALISAGVTAVFGIAGFFVQSEDAKLNYLLDPWILVDVGLLIVLALFVFRKSRVASTALLAYFVIAKVILWIELGAPKGAVLSAIFFLYFVTAMRATYEWHSKYRDSSIEDTA